MKATPITHSPSCDGLWRLGFRTIPYATARWAPGIVPKHEYLRPAMLSVPRQGRKNNVAPADCFFNNPNEPRARRGTLFFFSLKWWAKLLTRACDKILSPTALRPSPGSLYVVQVYDIVASYKIE